MVQAFIPTKAALTTILIGNSHVRGAMWSSPTDVKEVMCISLDQVEKQKNLGVAKMLWDAAKGSSVVVGGVVPKVQETLLSRLKDLTGQEPLQFRKDIPCPLKIIPKPEQAVGDDRLAGALGAAYLDPDRPWIIVDAGTAVTVNVLRPNLRFEGGVIAPGEALCLRMLGESTAQLPPLSPALPPIMKLTSNKEFSQTRKKKKQADSVVAKSTLHAIRNGVNLMQSAFVLAAIKEQKAEIQKWLKSKKPTKKKIKPLKVLLTGGGAMNLLADLVSVKPLYDPLLIHRGLFCAWLSHQSNTSK